MRLFVSLSRNALNVDELKAFLDSYHVSDVARKWLGSNVRRWAIENALEEDVAGLRLLTWRFPRCTYPQLLSA